VNQLRDNLKKLGLSPNHIFQLVKDSIGEDLAGGEDITSVATISSSQVSTADFTTRAAGVVSGLHVVAAVLEYCGVTHYEVLVDEGAKVAAGKVLHQDFELWKSLQPEWVEPQITEFHFQRLH